MRRTAGRWGVAIGLLALSGCASARVTDREATRLFRDGRYDDAAARLSVGVEKQGPDGKDLLLYLLDLGLAQHTAGRYAESSQTFLKADEIADIKDYTSLATETATLLTSDNVKSYKGEDFEKVLINVYLAINFASEGKFEDALVEARRVNRKLELMVTEGKRSYAQNAFARYLCAVLYEASREWDSAYIDYKKTHELMPGLPLLGRDLWRLARLSGRREDLPRWETEYALTDEDRQAAQRLEPKAGKGEIVVIYENGISPEKRPNPNFSSLPKFYPRSNPVREARIVVRGASIEAGPEQTASTRVLHDIEAAAIANLEEKYGAMVAKKLAGAVAKEVVGDRIGKATGNDGLGFLAKLIFYASDRADLRSWSLLPRDLQIARLTVDPGAYIVRAEPIGAGALPEKSIRVDAGGKVFVVFRYMPR